MALTNEDLQAIAALLQSVHHRLDKMNTRLDKVDTRLDKMDLRFEKLESEMSGLKAGQVSIRKELKEVRHTVADTYDLALEAWGKSTENRTWLETLPKL